MDRNTPLLIVIGIVIGIIVALIISRPPPHGPIVEDADHVGELSWGRIPIDPKATPRPLIEYPNTALTHSLIKAPSELEKEASEVLPRPLIEYSDSALSAVLQEPSVSFVALPRPLIEHSNSAAVFVLEQLTAADLPFSQVQPRPLVEYADAGWSMSLSSPVKLLKETARGD